MKYIFVILLFVSSIGYSQLSIVDAKSAAAKCHIGSYSYHEQFIGHEGYGAPVILTSDGGAAAYGDSEDDKGKIGLLVKIDKNGMEEWKQTIRPQFDDIESQSVVQDKNGNYYIFMLSYDEKKYRGGCQRIIYIEKNGAILWDKIISSCEMINNPTISYIRSLDDGRISLRGHIAPKNPPKGKDPEYRFWEGWIDSQGKLTQKTGKVIDWANQDWQKLYEPEK